MPTDTATAHVLETTDMVAPSGAPMSVVHAPQRGYGGYGHPAVAQPYYPVFPRFATVAGGIDAVASRIPWWVWVGGTLAAVWYVQRRGKRVRLVED